MEEHQDKDVRDYVSRFRAPVLDMALERARSQGDYGDYSGFTDVPELRSFGSKRFSQTKGLSFRNSSGRMIAPPPRFDSC